MASTFKWVTVGLRGLMELGIVIALGVWGYTTGDGTGMKVFLGVAAPLIGFGFWGLVDFRKVRSLAEPLRLIQELVLTGLAAFAWYSAGAQTWGWSLGLLSIVHHALVYLLGGTLLKH